LGDKKMKKLIFTFVVGILVLSTFLSVAVTSDGTGYKIVGEYKEPAPQPKIRSVSFNDSELIDEYTWAVMRYQCDISIEPGNFGLIKMTKPTPGAILVPANMMSMEVCRAAVSVYHEDKMDTLEALDEYDIENMILRLPFVMLSVWAGSHSLPSYYPTSSAHEMGSLGEICLRANFVGHCYSQALFNTAVLRLCGFSPEEVFTLTMPIHAVTIVQVEGQWYVFDSTPAEFARRGLLDSLIRDSMNPPSTDVIYWLENDKYFINFVVGFPEELPYLENPFSNIDPDILIDIVEHVVPMFNNSALGIQDWEIHEFIENATPCPEIATIEIPYSVEDATGSTVEEKAQSLADINKVFILNQTDGEIPNQYDRSLYGFGLLSVDYPQAYANAAKFATITSWLATHIDTKTQNRDCIMTVLWIRLNIINRQTMPPECVAHSDFPYLRRAGSSLDQAIMAYGTLRNMKKDTELWQPKDLYVLVTDDNEGYLAVNTTDGWEYLNFGSGKAISTTPPQNLRMSFNEIECLLVWKE
jgi:hypothetical protein